MPSRDKHTIEMVGNRDTMRVLEQENGTIQEAFKHSIVFRKGCQDGDLGHSGDGALVFVDHPL